MNITRESTGELTATIRMEIAPEDYQETVTKSLKEYQRKANIPGFRPGRVPYGLVKKMYGKAVMAEEVNRILSEQLSGYLTDEKLDLLGNPLPNKEKTKPARFEENELLEFFFDIGMAPAFAMMLGPELVVENYLIKVDDNMVDGYIADVRKRNGIYTHPETCGETDMISGEITELSVDGTPVEGIEPRKVYLSPANVTDRQAKKRLMEMKQGDQVVLNPAGWFGSAEVAAKNLGLSAEQLSDPDLTFRFSVNEITHVEPAELTADLFAKVYPGESIETEEDFRERVRMDAAASFSGETDKLLYREITKALLEKTEISLPDEFLKRWLAEHEENKMTEEEIGKNYDSFARSMKWQLIENRVIKENDIRVKEEEIRDYIRTYMLRQVSREFVDPEMAKKYETIVDAFMQNKEQVQKINDQLFDAKLMQIFREKVTLKPVEVSYDEFINLVTEKHDHDHDHDHEHGHDHQ